MQFANGIATGLVGQLFPDDSRRPLGSPAVLDHDTVANFHVGGLPLVGGLALLLCPQEPVSASFAVLGPRDVTEGAGIALEQAGDLESLDVSRR